METIIFATNNQHKVQEIKALTEGLFHVLSLRDAGIEVDIPEPFFTLHENATAKSTAIYRITGKNCFSEDTGLEVAALNGEPGVKSARYAGETKSPQENIDKLLFNLSGQTNRKARFRTVISLIFNNKEHLFEGVCTGAVTEAPKGSNGFGYDAVFIPDGATDTFAEMDLEEKNTYSHRKKAMAQLISFLSGIGK